MSFDLSEYVDVAERIRMFNEKYPEGSLQGKGFFVRDNEEKIIGYHYTAEAYRTAEDKRPGIGTAYEPIPGKTSYTRDSEVQNSETAAWGRAIVALGFNTKKIASAEEVRARQSDGVQGDGALTPPQNGAATQPPTPSDTFAPPPEVQQALEQRQASSVPAPAGFDGSPESVPVDFGKHKGKTLGEVPRAYLEWLAGEGFDPQTKDKRLLKNAAQVMLGLGHFSGVVAEDDIPF